jgi:hypothetical protein
MRVSNLRRKLWPSWVRMPDQDVIRDADTLIAAWGDASYETAVRLSWQEDTGLLTTSRPGHWWRVRNEIGHRFGRKPHEPEANFAA